MKKILITLVLAIGLFAKAQAQRVCAATNHLHHIENADPSVKNNRAAIEQHTKNFITSGGTGNTRAIVTIPVVVHVLYNNTTANISDAQIQSQIAVLNADFSKTNADVANTPTAFQSLVGNPDIQFCLAQRNPSGGATTGILRKSTTKSVFDVSLDDAKSNSTGGDDAWSASSYLNLWVVPSLKDGSQLDILGYAQFPGGPANTDGVVIAHNFLGTIGTASAPFNKGRTGTHEVGHWLNLYHIWGDDDNGNGSCTASTECSGSDLVGDTPNQCERNFGCPTFPRTDGCSPASPGVMYMNYMDYTDDACMFMFSLGQVSRMQALFATGGNKASLKTSLGCTPPTSGVTCGTPTGLSSGTPAQTSATLSWVAVAGASNYTLRYKTSAAATYTSLTVTGTSSTLTSLTATTTYNWDVTANCTGATSTAASASFTTAAATPTCTDNYETNETRTTAKAITVNTTITGRIGTATDVDWFSFKNTNAAKNIKLNLTNLPADYDLQLYRGATLVATSQLTGTSAELIKANNGTVTTYFAKVYGYGGVFNANSCYSLTASISSVAWKGASGNEPLIEENINLEKVTAPLTLEVYPNPSAGNITLDILNTTNQEEGSISIIDITGKVMYNTNTKISPNTVSSKNINLNLADGIYQIIVKNGEQIINKKLVIQH